MQSSCSSCCCMMRRIIHFHMVPPFWPQTGLKKFSPAETTLKLSCCPFFEEIHLKVFYHLIMSLIVGLIEFFTHWQHPNTTELRAQGLLHWQVFMQTEGKAGLTVGGQTFPQKKENEHIISLQPDELTDTIFNSHVSQKMFALTETISFPLWALQE